MVHPYEGDPKTGQGLVARTTITGFGPFARKARVNIDAAQAVWKEKDYGYLARRMLGVAPDDDWRYAAEDFSRISPNAFMAGQAAFTFPLRWSC